MVNVDVWFIEMEVESWNGPHYWDSSVELGIYLTVEDAMDEVNRLNAEVVEKRKAEFAQRNEELRAKAEAHNAAVSRIWETASVDADWVPKWGLRTVSEEDYLLSPDYDSSLPDPMVGGTGFYRVSDPERLLCWSSRAEELFAGK